MKTGIITTDTYSSHDTGQGHPERADRVTIVNNHLRKIKNLSLIKSTEAMINRKLKRSTSAYWISLVTKRKHFVNSCVASAVNQSRTS